MTKPESRHRTTRTKADVFAPVRRALSVLADRPISVRRAPGSDQRAELNYYVGTTNLRHLDKTLRDSLPYTSVRVVYATRGKSAGWMLDVTPAYTIICKRIKEPALYHITWEFDHGEQAVAHLMGELSTHFP